MKKLLVGLLALGTLSVFAQSIDSTDPSIGNAMKKLTSSHSKSEGVAELKAEIESKYGVLCEGSSSTVFPDVTKIVKYKAQCKGETQRMSLTVKSSFSKSNNNYDFLVKSYRVEIHAPKAYTAR